MSSRRAARNALKEDRTNNGPDLSNVGAPLLFAHTSPAGVLLRQVASSKGDEPWFVALDVCDALGLKNVSMACKALLEDEKDIKRIETPGGMQNKLVVNEHGLYRLVFRSDKPEARLFFDWVVKEVLPSIRKTGGYAVSGTELAPPRAGMWGPWRANVDEITGLLARVVDRLSIDVRTVMADQRDLVTWDKTASDVPDRNN